MITRPETRYAKSGDVHIAYQVMGEGPIDLVFVPGWVSHLDAVWDAPLIPLFYERLASFSRLIAFDKRGTGLSDRVPDSALPTLEQRMDDVRAVMDAVGSERAALFGLSEGGPMSVLFAATYPERTSALVLYGSFASASPHDDHPWEIIHGIGGIARFLKEIERAWGVEPIGLDIFFPSVGGDPELREGYTRFCRLAVSPGASATLLRMAMEIDVRDVLPAVRVPTLVLHARGDLAVHVEAGRYLAAHIPGARFVELPWDDHPPWSGDWDLSLGEVEEFLTGVRHVHEPDRVLATVLFTDIVRSTELAAGMGDHDWRTLLDRHDAVVGRQLDRFRGRKVHQIGRGDGVLATFDGPARAIQCARSIAEGVRALGLEVRAGLHTGEVEVRDDDLGGICVHTAARVMEAAGPGEVLVSRTVADLVAGSGLRFDDRGIHSLKGVPGEWRLFAVAG